MIEIEKLTKFYGSFRAVDDLNISIKRGEIVGLLGPNGAGKSTTMRMVTGFLSPSSGAVEVRGKESYSLSKTGNPAAWKIDGQAPAG